MHLLIDRTLLSDGWMDASSQCAVCVRVHGQMDRLTVPVAEHGVELEDDGLLVGGDLAPLQVRPEVVHPPQPAALPAPPQPCSASASHRLVHFIVSNNTTTLMNYRKHD